MSTSIDTFALTVIVVTFLFAGGVKGVIGLGLPTISLGLLSTVLDLTTAMALMLVPSLVTNVMQALTGGNGWAVLRRIWPFLLAATATIGVGAMALTIVHPIYLTMLLGGLLAVYAVANLLGFRISIVPSNETFVGVIAGVFNGIFTGMTGSFVVPGVMYLQAIGLPRDALVQAMGILFSVSTIILAIMLHRMAFFTSELSLISAVSVIPAALGMLLGRRIRMRQPEHRFRKIFFVSILLLGILVVLKAMINLD
jgi:uncharacterized membrane protein YfcA